MTTAVTSDGTLGTIVSQNGSVFEVGGGTRPGNGPNLFHSFDDFSIARDDTVRFTGPQGGLENILSRVTGGQVSRIDGNLESTIPGVNLYLLNPSGIVFGPRARLNVNGSFHISTADAIRMADGGRFAASLTQESSLTVAAPSAFGFIGGNPAEITIQGSLSVPAGEALSVIGGKITIDGGKLEARSGWVNLAAAASAGEIPFDGVRFGTQLSGLDGEIRLMPRSRVAISGVGGSVLIRGGVLSLDRAEIVSTVPPLSAAGAVGGGIEVSGSNVSLMNRARIASSALGGAAGGQVLISAEKVMPLSTA